MSPTLPPQLDPALASEAGAESSAVPSPAGSPRTGSLPTLPQAYRTIPVLAGASWLRKIFAFAGPGYLVAVGYVDQGNWATDYALLSVVPISNIMESFRNFPLNADFQLKLRQRTLGCPHSSVDVRV